MKISSTGDLPSNFLSLPATPPPPPPQKEEENGSEKNKVLIL